MNLRQLIEKFYILEHQEKLFEAIYTDEAQEQLEQLAPKYQDRISKAVQIFEIIGSKYKNVNTLGNGLFEIKPKDVRAYFRYHKDGKRIIIIGLVCLKTTPKAPPQNKEQAERSIEKYYNNERNL